MNKARKREFNRSKNFQHNADLAKMPFCEICGKHLKQTAGWIHIVDGGQHLAHPADDHFIDHESGGEMGWFPVGPDCAKALGEFVRRTLEG